VLLRVVPAPRAVDPEEASVVPAGDADRVAAPAPAALPSRVAARVGERPPGRTKDPRPVPPPPAAHGTIVVPAATVEKAIVRKDIRGVNATDDAGKALGARIVGVTRYGTGLRDGDVIVSVGGIRTPTTAAVVDAAMRTLSAGATRLTGRIARAGETYDVVLELPKL
jgi:hypothetical protein